ncbi:DNA repair exonuclease SbcCD ATPase subunit [Bradyrhizobium sp. USDA 4448]
MTDDTKKRPRGRPSVPEAEKKARNFTFRSRGDMHERLSEAAAQAGRSISEEIETRLSQSFEMESKMTAFRQEWEHRIRDHREVAEQARRDLEATKAEVKTISEDAKKQMAEQSALLADLQAISDQREAAANMVDILIGENEASRDLVRKIAFELMNTPDWDSSEAGRAAMAERIRSYIYPSEIFGAGV